MKYFHHAALWRLVSERLLRLPFYGDSGTVNLTAECAVFDALLKIFSDAGKQNQSGILAQNFFATWKSSRENFL
jgi:hypothetical protein